jgi:hypothetical protein
MSRGKLSLYRVLGVLGILIAFLSVAGVGAVLLVKRGDTFAKLNPFPVRQYLEGGKFWGDEAYKLEGRVDNVILPSGAGDTLLASIEPEGSAVRLPVLIHRKIGMKPVQRDQRLIFKVEFGKLQELHSRDYSSR